MNYTTAESNQPTGPEHGTNEARVIDSPHILRLP